MCVLCCCIACACLVLLLLFFPGLFACPVLICVCYFICFRVLVAGGHCLFFVVVCVLCLLPVVVCLCLCLLLLPNLFLCF